MSTKLNLCILDNNKTNLGAIASPEKWQESEWETFFLPQPLKSSSIQSENERDRKGERERQTYVNPSTDRGVISDPNFSEWK